MKKSFMMAAAMLLAAMGANAQHDISIGVKGGLNIPKITAGGKKTPLSEGYSSRLAANAGVFGEMKFTKTFSMVVGLEYSGQGGKNDDTVFPMGKTLSGMFNNDQFSPVLTGIAAQVGLASPTGAAQILALPDKMKDIPGYLYTDGIESTTKFNYVMLPVQARFGWNINSSPWRVYVQAGIFGSYLVSAKREMTGSSRLYTDIAKTTTLGSQVATILTPFIAANVTDVAAMTALASALPGIMAGAGTALGNEQSFPEQDITNELHRWNVGVIGSAGIAYKFHCRHSVFFEAGGNYGFVKLQKNAANGQNRIGAGSLSIGYSYKLGQSCQK